MYLGETDLLRSEVAGLSGLEFEGGSCFSQISSDASFKSSKVEKCLH